MTRNDKTVILWQKNVKVMLNTVFKMFPADGSNFNDAGASFLSHLNKDVATLHLI